MQTIPAKTIVTRTKDTSWFGLDYNMNIYRGCCHGCIYCDSRSECYHNDDFDTVKAKENALQIIRDDLRRKVKTGVVGTGSMSDPYNPFERECELTRHALELCDAFGFGVAIATKSPLILRDRDVLSDIRGHSPVLVKMTVTAADDALCRKVEPNVAPTSERLQALAALASEGFFCGVLLMPVLPFIEDSEENVRAVVRLAHESGARFIYPAFGVTLRDRQREHFYRQLDLRFPGLRARYERVFRERYECRTPNFGQLWRAFTEECGARGLLYRMNDIVRAYKAGYGNSQLSLF